MSFVPTGAATHGTLAVGPRASFGQRLAADLIDSVVTLVAYLILSRALGVSGSFLSLLIGIGYFTYLEGGPRGQTLGKTAMNIRVVSIEDGQPIGYQRALIRDLGRIVSAFPLYLGYFWMLWDPEKQTWHDKFARAIVAPTDRYLLRPR